MLGNDSFQEYTNLTNTKPSGLRSMQHAFYVVRVLVGIVTIVGNVMVIISFVKFPVVRKTSNYFLVSLAFADATSGLGAPLSLLINFVNEFHMGWCPHIVCVVVVNMNATALAGSAFSLMGIACERYIKVIYSLRYGVITKVTYS